MFGESMEIRIIEESKEKILFNLEGETHTLCNLLVKKLNEDKNVKYATYSIDHPLVGEPKVMIEGKDVRAALKKAISELNSTADELKSLAQKV